MHDEVNMLRLCVAVARLFRSLSLSQQTQQPSLQQWLCTFRISDNPSALELELALTDSLSLSLSLSVFLPCENSIHPL
ncbi:hypothetical protein EUGRSUZ_G00733 [Eucalyptus grandis]|uniref:Uncharacterized protein n=2 Tax=Eucalyptus grandis TaxID=71139 RepID=A0ACC3K0C9_EUCGR|nr:hypothetical protein EUGRSUZ_G00733 [Eucalyptus grandis]